MIAGAGKIGTFCPAARSPDAPDDRRLGVTVLGRGELDEDGALLGAHPAPATRDQEVRQMTLDSSLTSKSILELLDRPVEDRPFVQFRLRDHAPMASLVGALEATDSPDHVLALANVVGMRFRNAKSAATALVGFLQHPNEEVRYAVADALGKLRVGPAAKAMLEALPSEESPAVRAMLLSGVGAAGLRDGFDELVRGLADGSWVVRHGAAWGLGELGDPRGLPVLSGAASTEEDPLVLKVIVAAKASLSETLGEDVGG